MWRVKRLLLRGGGTLEALLKPIFKGKYSGFTLAEMMVVMLILSIVLAAMAPVITTRSKIDQSSPWKYSEGNLSDAYYGLGDSQTAMIGQKDFQETDEAAKLIINASNVRPVSIAFKKNGENIAKLYIKNDSDDKSFVIGDSATTNTNSTVIGAGTFSEGSGNYNTILGSDTMAKTEKSSYNVAIGHAALSESYGTDGNIAIGYNTLKNIKGLNRGLSYWPGNGSIAIGHESQAVMGDMTGHRGNTSIGFQSLKSCTSCGGNTGTGWGALRQITKGDGNSAFGSNALASISTGNSNTALGECAMTFYDSGTGNTAVGNSAMAPSAKGDYNTAIGYSSMSNFRTTGSGNTALGAYTDVQGNNSIAIGGGSETDYATLASGQQALAIGYSAKSKADNTVSLGNAAQASNTDAIAIGHETVASGESSIAIGSVAGEATTTASGEKAIAIGDGAVATGSAAVAIGNYTEANGYNNIALGNQACKGVKGSNKVCIGANSGPKTGGYTTDSVERIFIGSQSKFNGGTSVLEVHNTDATASFRNYGYGSLSSNATSVVVNGNLLVRGRIVFQPEVYHKNYVYDNCALTMTSGDSNDYAYFRYCGGEANSLGTALSSDRRLKYVGNEFTSGLDKIRALKVFNYTYKKDETKTPHVGVIAQDLQKIFPNAVKKGADGFLTIRMEDMFYAVINAIKELDAKVLAQEKRINELESIVKQQDARLKTLEAKIK